MNSPDWYFPGTASGMLGASITTTMGSPSRDPGGGRGRDEGQLGMLLLIPILIVLSASTIPEPRTGTSIPYSTACQLHSPVPWVFHASASTRAAQGALRQNSPCTLCCIWYQHPQHPTLEPQDTSCPI